jgi:protein-S-isoprenylcysteine O-methyltransferase Ste14
MNLDMMKKLIAFIYGIICYLIFFGSFLWLILFLGNFEVYAPTTVNPVAAVPLVQSLIINVGLIALFGIQHTVMARKSFKDWWTKLVPKPVERSTYVLFSAIALILILWFWQPLPETIWQVEVAWGSLVLQWGFWLGWLLVFLSTWMIDHFSLFGLRQVWNYLRGNEHRPPEFKEPALYKYVRHPLMLGFLIAFWSIPHMTVGHLVFSCGMTFYIVIGVYYEERAMVRRFGDEYEDYRKRVPKFFPRLSIEEKEYRQEELA